MNRLRISGTARRGIAQNPTPLRPRSAANGGLVPQVDRPALRAPVEPWAFGVDAQGDVRRAGFDLSDVLEETAQSIPGLLAPMPVHVFAEPPASLLPAAEALLAREGTNAAYPRVLVLPAGVPIGRYVTESDWLSRHGFVVVRKGTGEVGRIAARHPKNRTAR